MSQQNTIINQLTELAGRYNGIIQGGDGRQVKLAKSIIVGIHGITAIGVAYAAMSVSGAKIFSLQLPKKTYSTSMGDINGEEVINYIGVNIAQIIHFKKSGINATGVKKIAKLLLEIENVLDDGNCRLKNHDGPNKAMQRST